MMDRNDLPEDFDRLISMKEAFSGLNNRFCAPDRLYPLPPMGIIDRYSRCFVTQESHISKRDQSYCVACEKWMTEF